MLKFLIIFLITINVTFSDNFLFNKERAYKYLVYQCDLGPRTPGSKNIEKLRQYIKNISDDNGLRYIRQDFVFKDTVRKKNLKLSNLIVSYNVDSQRRIFFAAHYDTRFWADLDPEPKNRNKPIDGANDGASGVAVLLELMNIINEIEPSYGVDFIFLDGEDYGTDDYPEMFCLGSKYFVQNYPISDYVFGIVLDMIGDCDNQYFFEGYSDYYAPELNQIIFQIAQNLGISSFIPEVKHTILDDHLFFNRAGIKTIDIIDFDYPYWHTLEDTKDKCCANSLNDIGIVLETFLKQFK